MKNKRGLGELEVLVLLAVMQVGEGAYGVSISREIEERTGRRVARGALYVTLERLVEKACLRSWLGDDRPDRGGRRRRYYRVTDLGVVAAAEARQRMRSMWSGLESALERR